MKSTSIRLPVDLKKQLDRACVDRDTTLQLAIIQAIELWLGASITDAPAPPAPSAISPANARWHELLEDILSRPGEAEAVQVILDKFASTHRHPARKRLASGE